MLEPEMSKRGRTLWAQVPKGMRRKSFYRTKVGRGEKHLTFEKVVSI